MTFKNILGVFISGLFFCSATSNSAMENNFSLSNQITSRSNFVNSEVLSEISHGVINGILGNISGVGYGQVLEGLRDRNHRVKIILGLVKIFFVWKSWVYKITNKRYVLGIRYQNQYGTSVYIENIPYLRLIGGALLAILFSKKFKILISKCDEYIIKKYNEFVLILTFEQIINKNAEIDFEEQCAICFENNDGSSVEIYCNGNHQYHKGCIYRWLIRNRSCPSCRQVI